MSRRRACQDLFLFSQATMAARDRAEKSYIHVSCRLNYNPMLPTRLDMMGRDSNRMMSSHVYSMFVFFSILILRRWNCSRANMLTVYGRPANILIERNLAIYKLAYAVRFSAPSERSCIRIHHAPPATEHLPIENTPEPMKNKTHMYLSLLIARLIEAATVCPCRRVDI